MHLAARILALLFAGSGFASAADSELLARIRSQMREYLARLPDYTCRVTIERAQRSVRRAAFTVTDRLRLEIAYAGGREFYAWPGDAHFERSIDELLPARGMVSEGSFAMHVRKLFLTSDAQFTDPRPDNGALRIDFTVPASRSGFAVSAGGASAPAALHGSVWFDSATLAIRRLEVRVEDTPASVRIASTREVTTYAGAVVGETPVDLPAESELVLQDRDGSQRRNRSRFDDCHRYAAETAIRYDVAPPAAVSSSPAPARYRKGQRVDFRFESGIPADVAIGDRFTGGDTQVRVTDVRQTGNRWSIEFLLMGTRAVVRKSLPLPAPPGTAIRFPVE
jgi:hypothetical protein